jgi:hypothetical protein
LTNIEPLSNLSPFTRLRCTHKYTQSGFHRSQAEPGNETPEVQLDWCDWRRSLSEGIPRLCLGMRRKEYRKLKTLADRTCVYTVAVYEERRAESQFLLKKKYNFQPCLVYPAGS